MQFSGNVRKLRFGFDPGYALIHLKALIFLGDVIRGYTNVEAEIELSFGFVGRGFAFHLTDRALEHLRVKLEADGFDMATLLAAKHVAGSAQFEVKRGDFESRTEIGKFF